MLEITKSGQSCGASVRGVNLCAPLNDDEVSSIRKAWLEHHVLAFPDQPMTDDDLERFSQYFGPFGYDPFIAPIEGRDHVIAVKRAADETAPLFAENWHTDWSFQENPPIGTCLHSRIVPSNGGDTLYSNQHAALAAMPVEMRAKYEGLQAIHSAVQAYSNEGAYGDADEGRSMDIRPSKEAEERQTHALIRAQPDTGEMGLFGCFGYIIGFEGMENEESLPLLMELYQWQDREEFQYRHKWEKDMLVMWDNRSVLHKATGGYEGQERLLHRTTVGAIV